MNKKAISALIYYHDELAGILRKLETGYEFRYDSAYLEKVTSQPIAIALPLQPAPYQSQDLFPFFEGLLPEGWLLDITSKTAKIDKSDKFALLLHVGQDTIGAIRIQPLEEMENV